MLPISVAEFFVKVGDSECTVCIALHPLEIELYVQCYGLHMILCHVKTVTKALYSSLKVTKVYLEKFDGTLCPEAEVFFFSGTVDYGGALAAFTAAHFY